MIEKLADRGITTSSGDAAVLVPAAGAGVRLGGDVPKALRELRGESLLVHAVKRAAAAASVRLIVVAAPPHLVSEVRELLTGVDADLVVVAGGASRQDSVARALAVVPEGIDIVLVHDAARALTPPELVDAVASAVRAGHGAVIPVLPVVDTIKRVDSNGDVAATVDRSELRAVQTPQGFRREVLVKAHAEAGGEHTDDAGMVERLGLPVHCVPGSELALKITRPVDLIIAEALLTAEVAP
ncbi:2-C-methyl-D-erythritol 4-phosphate cytidylyltransferase [Hamadaea flava]|uniref:2-C-methyl-D-erythritol 4-phosphate cytidylyltransferase n=1 Tax=Hamadaea flava TaxID=1742688 RepID=A0ABV8LUT1_9ACTN|nr:2-C-methyl-D-erythritol 4-phosphate cytidylyltransferase [Hamadaea flava]MCP2325815.1 2-C-methyl-D-erythritol 4-phosphate cytidylyltransferase [Hamadaea flava]